MFFYVASFLAETERSGAESVALGRRAVEDQPPDPLHLVGHPPGTRADRRRSGAAYLRLGARQQVPDEGGHRLGVDREPWPTVLAGAFQQVLYGRQSDLRPPVRLLRPLPGEPRGRARDDALLQQPDEPDSEFGHRAQRGLA